MLPVSAANDLARLKRTVSHHGRIRRGHPSPPVGTVLEVPSPQMSQTESAIPAGMHAAADLASGRAEDRVVRCRHQHIDSELVAQQRIQATKQARMTSRPSRCPIGLSGQRLDTHRCTSSSVNQPAATSARRASSIFRCAYVSLVVVIEVCPSSLPTTSTATPRRNSSVA